MTQNGKLLKDIMDNVFAEGGQMIRRADGSYSRRGLWDNIRANRGSGKKPTKEMLEQERKIRSQEKANGGNINNNPMYSFYDFMAMGGTNNPGFRALPDHVQVKILNNMSNGGSTFSGNAWYGGGGMYPRYEDAGPVPQWHSEWASDPMMAEQFGYPYQGPTEDQIIASQDAQNVAANPMSVPAMNIPASKSASKAAGKGSAGSIVDFLNSQGAQSDFATRKNVAEKVYGFKNYTGTDAQNKRLLAIMSGKENPNAGSDVMYNPNDGNMLRKGWDSSFDAQFSGRAPFQRGASQSVPQVTPKPGAPKLPGKKNDDGVNPIIPIVGVAGALAAAGLTAKELMSMDLEKMGSTQGWSPAMKGKLTKAKNQLTKLAMQQSGKGAQEAVAEFTKAPKRLQQILDNLDAMEIPGEIYQMRPGTGMRNLEAWRMGQEAKAEQHIMDAYRTNQMLNESANEAAALRSANARKAAAARWGNNKAAAVAAQESKPWLTALREGYAAARATPLLKFLRKAEGGETDSLGEDIFEFVDPTGISSYDDVYRAWNNDEIPMWEKALITSTALPIVGKFGKAAKAATGARKALQVAGKVITPVAQMDKYVNPASRAVAATNAKLLENAPRAARIAGNIGSVSNQSGRFWTMADRMMGQPTRANGGYVQGQEIEITDPEQLRMLSQGGYTYEII